jgi:SAM-dependent methyltransferase
MRRDFAETYGQLDWHWWFEGRRRIIGDVLLRLSPPGATRLVSLGSGPVSGLRWLARHVEATGRVVGLDADPSGALGQAGAQDRGRGGRIHLVIGKAEAPPLRRRSWDVVLALDLLEHLDDDVAGLREMAGLVRPGGLLLVTVPALPSLWGDQDVVSHHRRRYTRPSLDGVFSRAGLPPPRITYFNTLLLPIVAAVRWARRLGGRPRRARSDFEYSRPGVVNDLLGRLFGAEKHLIGTLSLPVGVSLMATCRVGDVGMSGAGASPLNGGGSG